MIDALLFILLLGGLLAGLLGSLGGLLGSLLTAGLLGDLLGGGLLGDLGLGRGNLLGHFDDVFFWGNLGFFERREITGFFHFDYLFFRVNSATNDFFFVFQNVIISAFEVEKNIMMNNNKIIQDFGCWF